MKLRNPHDLVGRDPQTFTIDEACVWEYCFGLQHPTQALVAMQVHEKYGVRLAQPQVSILLMSWDLRSNERGVVPSPSPRMNLNNLTKQEQDTYIPLYRKAHQ